jgi:hypothetical protein
MHWFAALVVLLTSCNALADEVRFKLINGTNYPISGLVLSPNDLATWGPNVLKAPPIKPGDEREVVVQGVFVTCNVDLKVVFQTIADQPIWQYLNLCALQKIRLRFDQMSGITTASYEE